MVFKKLYVHIFILLIAFATLQSCEKRIEKKAEKKSNLVEINLLIEKGEKHFKNAKYDSSYYYFNKAKSLCDVKKDTAKIIYSILEIAYIQQNQGDYYGSETTILEALPFLKNNPKPNHHWAIYNIIGLNYLLNNDYDLALQYYNLAFDLKINQFRKSITRNNIAVLYIDMKKYDKALKVLLPLISEKEILNQSETYSIVLDNLGYCLYKTGNPKGIDHLNQALKIKKSDKNDWKLCSSYRHLSEYYQKSNQKLAYKYALLSYDKATKVNNADERLEALKMIIENNSGSQFKKHSLDYIRISDSLAKVRQKAKNQFAKIRYDSKLDKEENLNLKAQKTETALALQQQINRNLILNFVVIIGILLIIFLYYFFKAIRKKEKIQTSYDTETRISKKLHDEIANDVYQIMAFAETQDLSTNHNKEILLHNLDTIYSRTRSISKENSLIDTGKKYSDGLKEMMSGFNTNFINILTNDIDTINWDTLDVDKKIIIYRIIQELLVNMKKHSQCSLAVITFKENGNKLKIDYSDNGIGMSFDKTCMKNGLQNVESRILSIKGTIIFDHNSNKGFKTTFTIPI